MSSELPKGISQQAKIWSAYIAKNVKVQAAENSELFFLTGRTLLDKQAFNKLNNEEDDVVHGVQIIYGPFASKTAAQEFVSEYSGEWPGENEWRIISPGRAEILSSYYEPQHAIIVHNASLQFQGQLKIHETERKIKEIEEVKSRLRNREEDILSAKATPNKNEVEQHIIWQKQKIEESEKHINQLKEHLKRLEKLSVKEETEEQK